MVEEPSVEHRDMRHNEKQLGGLYNRLLFVMRTSLFGHDHDRLHRRRDRTHPAGPAVLRRHLLRWVRPSVPPRFSAEKNPSPKHNFLSYNSATVSGISDVTSKE